MSTPAAAYVASGRPTAPGNPWLRTDPAVPGPLLRLVRGFGRENHAKQGSSLVSSFHAGLSSVAGRIPASKAVHIVKVANSARHAPVGPFLQKGFARAAVRVMSRLPLSR